MTILMRTSACARCATCSTPPRHRPAVGARAEARHQRDPVLQRQCRDHADPRRPDQGRGAGDLPDLPTRQLHLGKPETPFLQIGETKYGKPILDRFIHPEVRLEDAARCALVSLDSTMRFEHLRRPAGGRRHPAARRAQRDTQAAAGYRYALLRLAARSWARQLDNAVRNLPKFEWEIQRPLQLDLPGGNQNGFVSEREVSGMQAQVMMSQPQGRY